MNNDLNLIVLAGSLAAKPELSTQGFARILVTTVQESPKRRVDVIPVTAFQQDMDLTKVLAADRGERVWVAARIQRKFWNSYDGTRSRIEVVALQVEVRQDDDETRDA